MTQSSRYAIRRNLEMACPKERRIYFSPESQIEVRRELQDALRP